MSSEKPDFEGLIAVIDAKLAALQRVRESIIEAASVGALGIGDVDPSTLPPSDGPSVAAAAKPAASQPVDLPTGAFRGKGLADAVRLLMSMAKRKQTFKEIKTALVEGGLATTSEFFDQTLNSTLHRMRRSGELLQFKEGWDLAESYPPAFRQRMQEAKSNDAPGKKRKGKKKAKKRAARTTPKKVEEKAESDQESKSPNLRAV